MSLKRKVALNLKVLRRIIPALPFPADLEITKVHTGLEVQTGLPFWSD